MKSRPILYFLSIFLCFTSCKTNSQDKLQSEEKSEHNFEIVKTDEEWKSELNDMEYYVIREKGTERAFTGDLLSNKEKGTYTCRACQYELFDSKTKFKSGTGWPSFYEPLSKEKIAEDTDHILGYPRTEVMCGRCGGHLGHVFNDGPNPTGLRYCINSVSLDFVPEN